MANVAQLVNNLHCLFLSRGDQFLRTPNYHVFEMYSAHQGGQSLRTAFSSPRSSGKLWGLAGSASLHDRQLILTVVNPSATESREAEIAIRGGKPRSWQARTLTSDDIHAHNTFDRPNAIEPKDSAGEVAGAMIYRFPAASVTRLKIEI